MNQIVNFSGTEKSGCDLIVQHRSERTSFRSKGGVWNLLSNRAKVLRNHGVRPFLFLGKLVKRSAPERVITQ